MGEIFVLILSWHVLYDIISPSYGLWTLELGEREINKNKNKYSHGIKIFAMFDTAVAVQSSAVQGLLVRALTVLP